MSKKTKDQQVRALMVAKLDADVDYLVDALRDPEIRSIAAVYLGDIGATEAIPELRRLLSAAEPRTRSAAIKGLTKLDARRALPDLLKMVTTDASAVVRSHAVGAIGRMGEPSLVVPVLLEALRDPDGGVSACAAEELGATADAAAIAPIKAASTGAIFLRRGAYRRAIRRIRSRTRK